MMAWPQQPRCPSQLSDADKLHNKLHAMSYRPSPGCADCQGLRYEMGRLLVCIARDGISPRVREQARRALKFLEGGDA